MIEKLQKLMASIFFEAGSNIACGRNMPYDLLGFRRVTDRLHIGNRWMAQSGFNTYDNTARMHYPLLPSFDVPDPLLQDYPSLSPYSHCAGNPISLIDPIGERIVVSSAGTEYEYKETPEDGYCFVDSNGKYPIGTHSFLYDVETALNKIQQGKNGKEMVNYLINNSNILTIAPIDNKHTENIFNISGNKIFWNSKSNEGGSSEQVDGLVVTTRPSYIGLAHEMAHAEDKWKGTMDQKIWIKNGPQNIPFSEIYACKRENQVRFEHKIPLRTHYMSGKHLGYDVIESSRIIFFIPPHLDINILYH